VTGPAATRRDAPPAAPAPALDVSVFRCPRTGEPLARRGEALVTPSGTRWPIVRGIPRFVSSDHYVDSFSFEWNTHDRTQLDSHTGSTSSEETFAVKTGLRPEDVRGRLVLDAGVGAGRFTDVLLRWGARVVGIDLSYAVEAAHRNFAGRPDAVVAQADIGRPPFAPGTFDLICSIGVLHHTPDTRRHFERLVPLLRPGGSIHVWVYPAQGDYLVRSHWIPFTSRIPDRWFHAWCRVFVPWAQAHGDHPLARYLARVFPVSDQGLGLENDVLDTFDGYSPRYHWVHEPDEVASWFREAGLVEVASLPWDTAVRGTMPERT